MELDAARCYRAVRARDRRFDGRFFTAVVSTGIYCRPICPARTPRAENVRFYACAAAAEEAGFRACLRCRPEAAPGTPAWVGSPAVVTRALRLIGDGALEGEDVEAFAGRLGLGERQLRRLFSTHLGVAPGAIARSRRAHLARRLLEETDLAMTAVSEAAGYESLRLFNHDLRKRFGDTPTGLRARRREALRGRAAAASAGAGHALRLRLPFRAPFSSAPLLAFLGFRAIPGVERVDAAGYHRTLRVGGGAGMLSLLPVAGASHVELRVRAPGIEGLERVVARARRVFDVDADPTAIAEVLRRSDALAPRLARTPGLRVPGAFDPFECAVRAVLGQQVSVRGATTLAGRLVERYGDRLGDRSEPALTHLFPTPERLAAESLEGVGLTRARAATIRTLAERVAGGALRLDASRGLEAFTGELLEIRGIGPWTAQYVAMRALGEPDAFPDGDLGLRRALGRKGSPVSARALATRAEAWRPWRAYAAMHLWNDDAPA